MKLNDAIFGKRVRAKWGTGGYKPNGAGVVVAYTTEPQIVIQCDDGSQLHWNQSLVEEDERLEGEVKE